MSRLFEQFGSRYRAGEIIFKEGDPAEYLFMIHRGRVQITKRAGAMEKVITEIHEPEFFGEMALISAEPRSATAIAVTDLELIRMNKKAFDSAIRDNASMAASVVRLLTRRLRSTDDFVSEVVSRHLNETVYAILLEECIVRGKRDATKTWILVSRREALAKIQNRLHMPGESLTEVFQSLKKERHIVSRKDSKGKEWIGIPIPK